MSEHEYWTGLGIDVAKVWRDYDEGREYEQKFRSTTVHLVRLTFDYPPANLPLFSHEAILKSLKRYFHDLKMLCFSEREYDRAAPLFLYAINRGSGIWEFLGELRQLLLFGTTLADEKLVGQKLDNLDKKLTILRKHFGASICPEDFRAFMDARAAPELEDAVTRMIEQGLRKVEISKTPFEGDGGAARAEMIDLKVDN